MILRVVKMEFKPKGVASFLETFDEFKSEIRSQPGCSMVLLLRDVSNPERFFTYSLWESEAALNHYRFSATFQRVWPMTKKWFSAPAEAWSTEVVDGSLPLPVA